MIALLSAQFARLWKTRAFWIMIGATAILSLWLCGCNYSPEIQSSARPVLLEDEFFTFFQFSGFISAAFISLFLGTEYTDSTIRNKLVAGHKRRNIYFSGLIVCIAACFAALCTHLLVGGIAGYLIFGGFKMGLSRAFYAIMCVFLLTAVYVAFCTAVAYGCQNRTTTAILTLLTVTGEMAFVGILSGHLRDTAVQGGIPWLRGIGFTLYQLLPCGQLQQISMLDFDYHAYWPWLSAAMFAVISLIGCTAFAKKDIK